jgi:hypothetical protein
MVSAIRSRSVFSLITILATLTAWSSDTHSAAPYSWSWITTPATNDSHTLIAVAQTTVTLSTPMSRINVDLTIQGGASGMVDFSTSDTLASKSSTESYTRRIMMKFDTQNFIPANAVIQSARLYLVLKSAESSENRPLTAFHILQSFLPGQTNWYYFRYGQAWRTAGGDLGTNFGTTFVGNAVGSTYTFDLTNMVQRTVRGELGSRYTRVALVDTGGTNSGNFRAFHSTRAANAAVRPRLVITYGASTVSNSRWPNEPDGFTTINDQPWNLLAGNGWGYLRRTASKNATIVADASAPFSPLSGLRMVFTTDMQRDSEPSVHWISLPRPTEIYSGWWMKVSPNWSCSPAGCGKITFLFPGAANGPGVTYSNLANAGGGSHYVNIATTWPSTGYRFWEPNVTKTVVAKDQWFRVEWYVKWASSAGAADGIIRWWVNGVLNGDYSTLPFPATAGFIEFQHAATMQNVPPAEQYMYIDHTHVSKR